MVQEITTESWGSRLMGSFKGMIVGFILIAISFFLIFWNEGHGLHTAKSLDQTGAVVVQVPNSPVDFKNSAKVVYFSGLATTKDTLNDPLLGVSINAIQLQQHVQMYQWKENVETSTESKTGGSEQTTKTYTYEKVWSDTLNDSSRFKVKEGHENPTGMPLVSKTLYADHVNVGDFNLPASLIQQIGGATTYDLSKIDVANFQTKINKPVKHDGEGLYVGADVGSPAIGDVKINVDQVLPQTVSVIGQQVETTVQPYVAPAGEAVILISMGQISAEQMIHEAQTANQIMTWVIRVASLIGMIVGLYLLMDPLIILADFLPFLGSIVGVGTGFVTFVGGFILWLIATSIAWFAVRPVWAVGMLVIAGLLGYMLCKKKKATV